MAKNTGKRTAIKHIRDGIKTKYPKGNKCAICGVAEDLEFHHYHTLSLVLKGYAEENNIPIETDEQVLEMRDQFYKDNWEAVVTDGVTLCSDHHKTLHKLYGNEPALSTASKQKLWIEKLNGRGTSVGAFGSIALRNAKTFKELSIWACGAQ